MRKKEKKERKEELNNKIKSIHKQKEEKKKSKTIIFLDKTVYWIALLIAILGNMLIAISLVPFLLTLDQITLYILIVVMGLAFGFFFEIVIRDIENLDKKHHIIIGVLIPSIAIISFFIITIVANNIKELFGIGTIAHEPLIVATTYTIAFILPYVVYQLILRK